MTKKSRRGPGEGHVRRRGKTSWLIKYDLIVPTGSPRKTVQETVRANSEREAKAILRDRLRALDRGVPVLPNSLTVEAYFKGVPDHKDRWIRDGWLQRRARAQKPIRPKTLERYQELLENQVYPFIGAIKLRHLRGADINSLYADLLERGRKDGKGGLHPSTVKHVDRLLHFAFDDAVKHEIIWRNPVTQSDGMKVKNQKIEIPTEESIERLLRAARGTRLYVPLVLLMATGLRRGELLGLRWRDIDLNACRLTVAQAIEERNRAWELKPPKTEKSARSITLPESVVDLLRAHRARQLEERMQLGLGRLQPDTLVFAKWDGTMHRPRNWSKELARIAKRAGVKITAHRLRHWHASDLLRHQVHSKVAQARLGHSSHATTMDIYSHLMPGLDEAAAKSQEPGLRALLAKNGK